MEDATHNRRIRVLTPETFQILDTIVETGSFAGAARQLNLVPSALSYRIRQIEEALDVLLFDRSARNARLTPAGAELVREGRRLLTEMDAVSRRVQRVATGWEPRLTIVVDSLISRQVFFELCARFYALNPPTQLRLRAEVMSGTWEALVSGKADLALGGALESFTATHIRTRPIGELPFVFAVAPDHPLASAEEPIPDELIARHRAVAVADSGVQGNSLSIGLLPGQDVLTVPSMQGKLDAQLFGLGCGFLPLALAAPYIKSGRLIQKNVQRSNSRISKVSYAWRAPSQGPMGHALTWWLDALNSERTCKALLEQQEGGVF